MSTQQPGPTALKRGSFARDARTGQIVIVKEHGRGADYMVRSASSRGYWVGRADLVPAANPYAWRGVHFLFASIALVVAGWRAWAVYDALTAEGVGTETAVFAGAVPTGFVVLFFLLILFRLNR